MMTCPDPPPVTVVLDPFDDALHTRAALAAHDLTAGRLTVHPTPGTDSTVCLAYDVLAALGKPIPVSGYPGRAAEPPWALAAAWILATSTTHLTVLRAHLLDRRRLQDLLDLRSRTGLRLALVCHRGTVPAPVERMLAPVGYQLAHARAVLPGSQEPSLSQLPPYRPLAGRWLPLSALTTLVALDGRDRRCRCTAPAARARGFHPPQMRASVSEEIAHRLHAATAHPYLAAELATAVLTAASTTQLATVHPGDLTPGATAITLHDPSGLRQGCLTHQVPSWARPFLLAAAYLRSIAGVPDEPLFTPPFPASGLPAVTRFAEACKLRPPQPRRSRPAVGTRRSQPPGKTVWPLSAAHYHYPWAVTEDMRGCPPPPSPGRRWT